ncbi:cytochrome c biogenesis protein ResB [Paludibacterium yongneupense]|uniref:cytochrome c biogenesis protein ResB n=1 Tax=Paludibacterium yongneupense TaxID=400061 RepID=UPI0003FEE8B8|nr:cytochrome c biogenesis protein ResB [Paludibacterium yongneupense]
MKNRRLASFTLRSLYELLSSMRFAIGMLTIVAIASVIGTVLKQNEPYPNYAFEFGAYWFRVFETLGLYDVYHSGWFLTILSFLVLSTTLCIVRNGPAYIKDMKSWRENATAGSLASMRHSALFRSHEADPATIGAYLSAQGFRFRISERDDRSTLLAAKKGTATKFGYFFAHGAMVLICLGGLIDGNLPLKLAQWTGRVQAETREIPQAQIPARSRLGLNNLSFRGDVNIAENKSADVVFINAGQGYLVQELPFIVTLKAFHVDYYSNGMPKLFASDIVVTDKASGKETPARVEVNHPLIVKGIAIYQASFGDGGSPLVFDAWNLEAPQIAPVTLNAQSLSSQPLVANGKNYTLEFGELRVINVENMAAAQAAPATLAQRMNEARSVRKDNTSLHNVGPSISFKLRDSQGQAHEYLQYMTPVRLDGANYVLAGMRSEVGQPFRYLRLPLDDEMSIARFMRLRATLLDPGRYEAIAARSTAKALQGQAISSDMRDRFRDSVKWILARFAQGGFAGLERFLDQRVPADKRADIAQTYVKILQGAIIDAMDVADQAAGAEPLRMNESHYRFLLDGLVAMSALNDYASPVLLQLRSFKQVQSTGLQITRSPGKTLVYLGSMLLVLGIFLMFYVRELRIWVVLSGHDVRIAMTSNRHNRDLDTDFDRHRDALKQLLRGE